MKTSTFAGLACSLFLMLHSLFLHGQAFNYLWAKALSGNSVKTSICTDPGNNVFAAGNFVSSTAFGSTTLTAAAGGNDYFIAKYDGAGNPLWARSGGGTGGEIITAVCSDASGNAYVLGYSTSTLVTIGSNTFTGGNYSNLFVAKYDPAGNVLWADMAYNLSISPGIYGTAMCTDLNNDLYITGGFQGVAAFGGYTLSPGSAFVAKYNSAGGVSWAKPIDGSSNEAAWALAANPGGGVLVAGTYGGTVMTMGSYTLTNSDFAISNNAYEDVFLAAYDNSGNVTWAASLGETGHDNVSGMAVAPNGDVVLAGSIQYQGQYHYLAKYGPNTTLQWKKTITPAWSINTGGVALDATGNVFLAGTMQNSLAVIGTHTLNTYGDYDALIAEYTSSGYEVFAENAGSAGYDYGADICVDAGGHAYASGSFALGISFGSHTLTPSSTGSSHFIVKIDSALLSGTGLRTIQQSDELSMYPNPAKDQVTVKTNGAINRIEIINSLGETVYSEIHERSMNSAVIGLQQLPKGLYVISIISGTQRVCKKMILEP